MPDDVKLPRVLIVADNASARFGGEAILPLHYFQGLRRRGAEAWLLVNARNRDELSTVLPAEEMGRVYFVPDTAFHRFLEKIAKPFSAAVKHSVIRVFGRLRSQLDARRMARKLVADLHIDVVHQPTPVSPKETSLIDKVGAPVVIGPMNGGMTYPPGFERSQGRGIAGFYKVARYFSHGLNRLMPGKLRAKVILVANERTRAALPAGIKGQVIQLVENGVKLDLWESTTQATTTEPGVLRVAFSGRLVDWKGVQYLLPAFARLAEELPATLTIMGNGVMRARLEAQAKDLELDGKVRFLGWKAQAECAAVLHDSDLFVLPSLFECGGAVVLEAMACGLPVIATRWGGPADYLDDTTGILIDPQSPKAFIDRLYEAMKQLAQDAPRRKAMGQAGRLKVAEQYDWDRKIERILEIYDLAIRRGQPDAQ